MAEESNEIIAPECYFINYESNAIDPTITDFCLPHEIDKYKAQGFTQVTKRELWDYKDRLFDLRQARHEKTKKQRLARMLPANKLAKKKSKIKGTKNPDGTTKYFDCDD